MSTITNRYLDAVKAKLCLPSDNRLAKEWEVTPQRIYEYRRGATSFSDERCIHVAQILEIAPEKVLLEIQAERARKAGKTGVSDVLERVLQRLNLAPHMLAIAATGVLLSTYSADSSAAFLDDAEISHQHSQDVVIIHIMSSSQGHKIHALVLIFSFKFDENLSYVKSSLSLFLLQPVIVSRTAISSNI